MKRTSIHIRKGSIEIGFESHSLKTEHFSLFSVTLARSLYQLPLADKNEFIMEGKRLYVGNLTYSVNEGNLRELFGTYGEIESVKVIEQKGFAFVEMGTVEQAQAAMDALNGTDYEGRTLRIDEARPMQPRRDFGSNSGSFGGNRSSGGYGGNRSSGGYGGNRRY